MSYRFGSGKGYSNEDVEQLLDCFSEEYSPIVAFAKRSGVDALRELTGELGGLKPHIPEFGNFVEALKREVRNEEMRARFNGRNYEQLALEYGIQERQARKIISEQGRRYVWHEKKAALKITLEHRAKIGAMAEACSAPSTAILEALLNIAFDMPDVEAHMLEFFSAQQDFLESA